MNLLVVGPVFAVAAAGSAAGSLALARRAQDREVLETTEDLTAVELPEGERERCCETATDLAMWIRFAVSCNDRYASGAKNAEFQA